MDIGFNITVEFWEEVGISIGVNILVNNGAYAGSEVGVGVAGIYLLKCWLK